MEKVKNFMKMEKLDLKENIYKEKNGKEKLKNIIIMETLSLKENI